MYKNDLYIYVYKLEKNCQQKFVIKYRRKNIKKKYWFELKHFYHASLVNERFIWKCNEKSRKHTNPVEPECRNLMLVLLILVFVLSRAYVLFFSPAFTFSLSLFHFNSHSLSIVADVYIIHIHIYIFRIKILLFRISYFFVLY